MTTFVPARLCRANTPTTPSTRRGSLPSPWWVLTTYFLLRRTQGFQWLWSWPVSQLQSWNRFQNRNRGHDHGSKYGFWKPKLGRIILQICPKIDQNTVLILWIVPDQNTVTTISLMFSLHQHINRVSNLTGHDRSFDRSFVFWPVSEIWPVSLTMETLIYSTFWSVAL